MQQHMVVAVMASVMWALVGGTALGQVAGSSTLGVTVDEQKVLAVGWSAKKTILDKAVYNSSGEKIGEVEDLIITPGESRILCDCGHRGFPGHGPARRRYPGRTVEARGGQADAARCNQRGAEGVTQV